MCGRCPTDRCADYLSGRGVWVSSTSSAVEAIAIARTISSIRFKVSFASTVLSDQLASARGPSDLTMRASLRTEKTWVAFPPDSQPPLRRDALLGLLPQPGEVRVGAYREERAQEVHPRQRVHRDVKRLVPPGRKSALPLSMTASVRFHERRPWRSVFTPGACETRLETPQRAPDLCVRCRLLLDGSE